MMKYQTAEVSLRDILTNDNMVVRTANLYGHTVFVIDEVNYIYIYHKNPQRWVRHDLAGDMTYNLYVDMIADAKKIYRGTKVA